MDERVVAVCNSPEALCRHHGRNAALMRVTIQQERTGINRARSVRTAVGRSILFVSLAVLATGCQMTQSPFVRVTGETGAELAAAATTLQYAHEGQLTHPYAQAAFEGYASALTGADQEIIAAEGAPSQELARRLADLSREAAAVAEQPCLTASCNWQGQLTLLRQASAELIEAAGG